MGEARRMEGDHARTDAVAAEEVAGVVENDFVEIVVVVEERHLDCAGIALERPRHEGADDEPAGRLLTRLWKFSRLLGLLFSLVVGGLMSMFVNDTPVLEIGRAHV